MQSTNPAKAFNIQEENWTDLNMFPEFMYIDTNAVLEMLIPTRRFHKETVNYVNELHQNNGIILWSDFVTQELYDFFQYEANYSGAKKLNMTGKESGIAKQYENRACKSNSILTAKEVRERIDGTESLLSNYGVKLELSNNISELASAVHLEYGSNIKDANHIAVCQVHEVNNILTHDANVGFLRYDNYNIYGSSWGIKNSYMPNQSPNSFVRVLS